MYQSAVGTVRDRVFWIVPSRLPDRHTASRRRSWIGAWYGPDGRRVRRKVGDVRTEGRADGLTKAQAERALRRMRGPDSPPAAPGAERMTIEQSGREFCARLELKGRRKSHRLTVASDLRNHI